MVFQLKLGTVSKTVLPLVLFSANVKYRKARNLLVHTFQGMLNDEKKTYL